MTMTTRTLETAIDAVGRYCDATYPGATLVLLCGSWVRGQAHDDSDIDVLVLDPNMADVLFEGVLFDSWLIEVCALSPAHVADFFRSSALSRSAPVPHQVVDGLLVRGDEAAEKKVKAAALDVLNDGPAPLSEAERMDARWRLTQLLRDLTHAAPPEIPALGAQCHAELGRAVLDSSGSWRAERKFLRTAVARVAPAVAECLDEGLRLACQGDPNSLLELGREILGALGGELRTYSERY